MIGKAKCRAFTGDWKSATEYLDQLLKHKPDFVDALTERAQLAAQQQDYAVAVELLNRAIEREPYRDDAISLIVDCLRRLGRAAEVDQFKVRLQAAKRLRERCDFLREQVVKNPNDADAVTSIIEVLRQLKKEREADRWQRRLEVIRPSAPWKGSAM
jgi:tetratricopeptide (TPR) repeat protein